MADRTRNETEAERLNLEMSLRRAEIERQTVMGDLLTRRHNSASARLREISESLRFVLPRLSDSDDISTFFDICGEDFLRVLRRE